MRRMEGRKQGGSLLPALLLIAAAGGLYLVQAFVLPALGVPT